MHISCRSLMVGACDNNGNSQIHVRPCVNKPGKHAQHGSCHTDAERGNGRAANCHVGTCILAVRLCGFRVVEHDGLAKLWILGQGLCHSEQCRVKIWSVSRASCAGPRTAEMARSGADGLSRFLRDGSGLASIVQALWQGDAGCASWSAGL